MDHSINNLAAVVTCFQGVAPRTAESREGDDLITKLCAIDKKLDSLLVNKMSQNVENNIRAINEQLAMLSGARENESSTAERNENIFQEDRKRLKERLIAAVDHRELSGVITRNISWKEKIFGIRQADGRLGKERSRS